MENGKVSSTLHDVIPVRDRVSKPRASNPSPRHIYSFFLIFLKYL